MGGRRLRLVPARRATSRVKDRVSVAPATATARDASITRIDALLRVSRRATRLAWTPALFAALIDELIIGDDFVALLGDPAALPRKRYAQGVAVALAIRHSFQDDDLRRLVKRLKLPKR